MHILTVPPMNNLLSKTTQIRPSQYLLYRNKLY